MRDKTQAAASFPSTTDMLFCLLKTSTAIPDNLRRLQDKSSHSHPFTSLMGDPFAAAKVQKHAQIGPSNVRLCMLNAHDLCKWESWRDMFVNMIPKNESWNRAKHIKSNWSRYLFAIRQHFSEFPTKKLPSHSHRGHPPIGSLFKTKPSRPPSNHPELDVDVVPPLPTGQQHWAHGPGDQLPPRCPRSWIPNLPPNAMLSEMQWTY